MPGWQMQHNPLYCCKFLFNANEDYSKFSAQSTGKLAGASRSSVPLALKEWRKFNQLTFINETAVCARLALQMFFQDSIGQ